jgi:hypothetical protein
MRVPETKLHRQVFLDHDLPPERRVFCQIRNSEAAAAEHPLDHEFLQPRSGRKSLAANGAGLHDGTVGDEALAVENPRAKVELGHGKVTEEAEKFAPSAIFEALPTSTNVRRCYMPLPAYTGLGC